MSHRHRLRPSTRHVRRRAVRRLDEAIEALGRTGDPDPDVVAEAIHDVRICCKEVRALARLLKPAGDVTRRRVDGWVRTAGSSLGTTRDAQVLAETLSELPVAVTIAPAAGLAPEPAAIERATVLLRHAHDEIGGWRVGRRSSPIVDGVATAYRVARRRFAALHDEPDDERMHEWRRSVKRLTYQVRAVRRWAPSILRSYEARLDELGSLLGTDHDLAVAVMRLEQEDAREGTAVAAAIQAARARQGELRDEALRLGASLFAETPTAFRRRLRAYVRARRTIGREPHVHPV